MSDDEAYRASYERLRATIEALTSAPPLEKARTFLKKFIAATEGFAEIDEQIQHSLKFNPFPAMTGLEGLEIVLRDPALDPGVLVDLVRRDANYPHVTRTPEAAREFLTEIVSILRRQLGDDEPEGPIIFDLDFVYTLPNTAGHVERLLCVEMLLALGGTYAVFVPEGADGPFTVYKYEMFPGPQMTYELVTDEATRVTIVDISES
jgi:hypothetical protein